MISHIFRVSNISGKLLLPILLSYCGIYSTHVSLIVKIVDSVAICPYIFLMGILWDESILTFANIEHQSTKHNGLSKSLIFTLIERKRKSKYKLRTIFDI